MPDRRTLIRRVPRAILAASLLITTSAAQAQHNHVDAKRPPDQAVAAPREDLGGLLKTGDEALRAVDRAVQHDDPSGVGANARRFEALAESIASYFETDDPRSGKDVTRARRALERYVRVLRDLSARASAQEAREPLDAAHDTALRALESVEAAIPPAEPDLSSEHASHSSHRGCGGH